jgi:hypothetical protein
VFIIQAAMTFVPWFQVEVVFLIWATSTLPMAETNVAQSRWG